MSGVTDVGMRRVAQRFGAGMVVSEMVASEAFLRGQTEARLRAEGSGIDQHVVQIAGCEPNSMAEAARLAEASGAAVIDINMGCPSKRVIGGYAGSALMRDLDHALALIEATVQAVGVPVTLKMRLGWDDASRNAAELARRAENAGIQMITVHGRTRSQFYDGAADWDAIRSAKEAVAIPVVANGDCRGLADARMMLARSGADAVMIGRAAVGRPWLVGAIARALESGGDSILDEPDARARSDAALEHYEALLDLFGERQGLRHARKHLVAYAEHAGPHRRPDARAILATSEKVTEVRDILGDLFADEPLVAAA